MINMDLTKHYSQLVGGKIVRFEWEEDEFGGDDFPVFHLLVPTIDHPVRVTISRDFEGNGGGALFIEEEGSGGGL